MVDLPKKKVGIVACSGEELPEGTITRLAALEVLEGLRPADTVTICLPLFLAGGEGDRAFARFYPTIAVDGCDKRCAARGTRMYSGKPAASLVVSELLAQNGLGKPEGLRRLNAAGMQAVNLVAEAIASRVDELLDRGWNRRTGEFEAPIVTEESPGQAGEPAAATCSCGSGIPIQDLVIDGQTVTMIALPLIFDQLRQAGKPVTQDTACDLLATVKIYNPIPAEAEESYSKALLHEYAAFLEKGKSQ